MVPKMWTEMEIGELLNTNPKFLERSLLQLLAREQKKTKEPDLACHSDFGFNKTDVGILTYYAKFVQFSKNAEGSRLFGDFHIKRVQSLLYKYRFQLTQIANELSTQKNHPVDDFQIPKITVSIPETKPSTSAVNQVHHTLSATLSALGVMDPIIIDPNNKPSFSDGIASEL